MDTNAPITVRVTAEHIRTGIPNDCYRCAVALALRDATGDPAAHVSEHGYFLGLAAWSRAVIAPARVRDFIEEFDGVPRTGDGRIDIDYDAPWGVLAPFDFELPPPNDPAWLVDCRGCEQLFAADDLDADGYCDDCREEADPDDPDDRGE